MLWVGDFDKMTEQIMLIVLLVGSILLDFLLGDPHGLWHPVIGMGWLIQKLEKILRYMMGCGKWRERIGGLLLWILVCSMTAGISLGIWILGKWIHPILGNVILVIYGYQVLAAKSLKTESMKVYDACRYSDLSQARRALSMIVGRDTAQLEEAEIVKATVETIAENTSDGVIAPLFYSCIFGPIGGMIYKAINTMDSMIGYRNETYRYFGSVAAKMDDLANYIPARLSAGCLLLASIPSKSCTKNGWKIFLRDRYHHASPNSAQTESVMAGLLGIRLGGDAFYFGELHKKETMGDPLREPQTEDIKRANRLMYGTTIVAAGIFLAVRLGVVYLLFR